MSMCRLDFFILNIQTTHKKMQTKMTIAKVGCVTPLDNLHTICARKKCCHLLAQLFMSKARKKMVRRRKMLQMRLSGFLIFQIDGCHVSSTQRWVLFNFFLAVEFQPSLDDFISCLNVWLLQIDVVTLKRTRNHFFLSNDLDFSANYYTFNWNMISCISFNHFIL